MYRVNLRDKYWIEDGLYEESVDEFIIRAGGSDDESQMGAIPPAILKIATLNNFCTSFYLPVCVILSYIYIQCWTSRE